MGFANWGKSNTLRNLFDRHTFFSTKSPIYLPQTDKLFTVINMSNDDIGIQKYSDNFQAVSQLHNRRNHNYVITLCPVLDNGRKDCRPFFPIITTGYSIHVITLGNKWHGDGNIDRQLANQIAGLIGTNNQLYCEEVIDKSATIFNQRTQRIRKYILANAN